MVLCIYLYYYYMVIEVVLWTFKHRYNQAVILHI